MAIFDFNKIIIKPAGKSLRTISVYNPLTIHKKVEKENNNTEKNGAMTAEILGRLIACEGILIFKLRGRNSIKYL